MSILAGHREYVSKIPAQCTEDRIDEGGFRVSLRKPIGAIFSANHVRKDALNLVS